MTGQEQTHGRPQEAVSRRVFLSHSAAVLAVTVIPGKVLGQGLPSNTLNIAGIGIGGRGGSDIKAVSSENIVALCDVDLNHAAGTFKKFPRAMVYRDFRVMLDKEDKRIDAVVVATPDHTHAVAVMDVIRRGKHVYCEKPLAHSIYETRMVTEAARKYKVQTQMGNQGHSSEHIRLLKEWIEDGAIGAVREVHAWSDRPVGGNVWSTFDVRSRPKEKPAAPEGLDWDLWLGPAAYRPYHPCYVPTRWRAWMDFGTGALGDMGCHILDPVFWALKLRHPIRVQATTTHWQDEVSSETYPRASIVRYEFPARGALPPVKLTWWDGRLKPPIPKDLETGRKLGSNGAIILGETGTMMHGSHGAGGLRIVPETKMRAYERPTKTIRRVVGGHQQDWVRACKDGQAASSNFEYGGALTEMVLLGVLAIRNPDKVLEWDAKNMRITNDAKANEMIRPVFRKGWSM